MTSERPLAEFGVKGSTDSENRGVWVGDEKIAALGVRVTKHITMHGFALNVNTNLDYYKNIVPCGIHGKGVTSLHLLKPGISMEAVKKVVVDKFKGVLGY